MLNIELLKNNGLKHQVILELPTITVICGQNNSGKTTILKSLSNHQFRRIGDYFDDGQFENIYRETCKLFHFNNQNHLLDEYRAKLLQIKEKFNGQLIFQENIADITNQIQECIRTSSILEKTVFPVNQINAVVQKLVPIYQDSEILLISSYRNIGINSAVSLKPVAQSNGTGVVSHLFYLKSQVINSGEYEQYNNILESFKYVTKGYTFDIVLGKNSLLNLKFSNDRINWHSSEVCGLGLGDILIIIYFMYRDNYKIILLEEPETHLHPEIQRRLLIFLKSNISVKHLIIATHSNVFLDSSLVNKIYFTKFENEIKIEDATEKAEILNDLGYNVTDNLLSDLIILVEGPTDIPIYQELLRKYGLTKNYNIKFWPLGGDIMDQLDLSIFSQLKSIIAIIDQDTESRKIRDRFIKNCEKLNILVYKLERYSIENYFTLDALKDIFGSQLPDNLSPLDPLIKLENQIGMNVKKNNRKIAKKLTQHDIEQTDLHNIILKIEELLIQKAIP